MKFIGALIIILILCIGIPLVVQPIRVVTTSPDIRQIEVDFKSLEYEPSEKIKVPQVLMDEYFDSRIIDLSMGYLLLSSYDEWVAALDFITYDKGVMHSANLLYKKDSLWPRKKSLWPMATFNNHIKEMSINYEPGDSKIRFTFKPGNLHLFALGFINIIGFILTAIGIFFGLALAFSALDDIIKWKEKRKEKQ